jgi:two-component system, OmpR family, phosphate regulon response regulator PhoB
MGSNFTKSILIALTDERLLAIISFNLERYGFIVNSVRDLNSTYRESERVRPHLIIIDEELPGANWLTSSSYANFSKNPFTKDVCLILLSKQVSPSLALKEEGLIHDYIIKPFAPSTLVTKINNLFNSDSKKTIKILEYKDLKMNVGAYKVTRNGRTIHLGPTEFRILQCLMELPSRILSREHIMNQVWGFNSKVEPRTIDVHINRLRVALKNDNEELPLIKTVRSAGYCLGSGID